MAIRDIIDSFGFDAYGVAPYGVLDDHRHIVRQWIAMGYHADLEYMERWQRDDPRLLLASCRSLVVILFAPQRQAYHGQIRKALKRLLKAIQEQYPDVEGRGVVDTAPILEKAWAVRAGLGCVGRNTLLVNPDLGTDFNIGILLLDAELPYDKPFEQDLCRHCSLCIEECPSAALQDNRTLDCRICLSYLAQQNPVEGSYGCTICQRHCKAYLRKM